MIPETVLTALQEAHMPEASGTESDMCATVGRILHDNLSWILNSGLFSEEQQKAACLMAACKTPAMGTYVEYCPECDKVTGVHYCSCNNRNCPNCQFPLQQKWIELRKSEVVPDTPYFHIILTIPHELNPLILQNQKETLGILFRTSAAAVIEMCEDPKYLGAKPGIISVLHTWTQDLRAHYHIHMICTAGGLDENGWFKSLKQLYHADQSEASANANHGLTHADTIRNSLQAEDLDVISELESSAGMQENAASSNNANLFFLPVKALMRLFRGKYMAELRKLYDTHELRLPDQLTYLNDPYEWSAFCRSLYGTEWVGYIARTFEGRGNAIDYLARYTFRTAISNSRIISYDGNSVSFTVRNNDAPGQKDVATLDVHKFIRRLLSHILPKGFTRVRFYGFLANGQKKKCLNEILQQLCNRDFEQSELKDATGINLLAMLFPDKNIGRCPCCGCGLQLFRCRDLKRTAPSARAAPAA